MQKKTNPDLTRITLQVLWIGVLIAATFWIMRPLLPSIIWAAMIVVATWPLMLKAEKWLWGRRAPAVSVMTLAMLFIFIIPFSLAIIAIIENADGIVSWVNGIDKMAMPALPAWVSGIPLIGHKLASYWQSAAVGSEEISARLAPHAGKILGWFLSQAGGVGIIMVQFLLTVIIAAILYSKGEVAAAGVIRLARRLGNDSGEDIARLAAQTIKGVALGVVGTALVQALLGGLGLAIAGVPAAAMLTAVIFILCIAQLPSGIVLVPAVVWLYYNGETTWGTVLLIFTVFISAVDNILRPLLIRMGADLPLLLIFAGVIGGLVSFGIVGLFIGPVVLAVTFRLLEVWVGSGEALPERGQGADPPA